MRLIRSDRLSLLWVAVTVGALASCSRNSDEDRIRTVLSSMESAAEERNTSKFMELIADDYSDDAGRDKAQLKYIARAYFLTHPRIELIVSVKDIAIDSPSRARVHLELSMVGTQRFNDSTSLAAQSEILRVDLKRSESTWKIVRADRRRD